MLLAAIAGIAVIVVVARLFRRGQLSFRYTIGWMMIASLGVLAGLFIPVAEPVADILGVSAAALLGLAALVFITALSIQLSISISGLQRQNNKLAEELARIRNEFTNPKFLKR